jgi:hypothetical protein
MTVTETAVADGNEVCKRLWARCQPPRPPRGEGLVIGVLLLGWLALAFAWVSAADPAMVTVTAPR